MIRLLPLIVLAGCAPAHKPDLGALLEPCPIAAPKRFTNSEAVRVANLRGAALIKCNEDKAKLRALLQ